MYAIRSYYAGNPLAMSAGIATLKLLKEPGFYDIIEEKSAYLCKGLSEEAKAAGVPTSLHRITSYNVCYTKLLRRASW